MTNRLVEMPTGSAPRSADLYEGADRLLIFELNNAFLHVAGVTEEMIDELLGDMGGRLVP